MGTKTVSASDLRSNLADALDAVNKDEILIVTRRGKKERAIIDLDSSKICLPLMIQSI